MGIKVAFVSGPEEHLGLECLSAALKSAGHDVEVFVDPQLFKDEVLSVPFLAGKCNFQEELLKDIVAYRPGLVGFSVTSDFSGWADDLAAKVKSHWACPVIFGGIHPTSVPEQVLSSPAVDMVCVGEGDQAIVELADSLAQGRPRTDIANVWFKAAGTIIRNPVRAAADLEVLPPPDPSLYRRKYGFLVSGYHTIASRGCPMRCSYCCHSVLKGLVGAEGYYRVRPVAKVIDELRDVKARVRFDIVRFCDDIFPYDEAWLEAFALRYKAEVDVPFICYFHPGLVTERRMALLQKSGCVEVRLGIQSLTPRLRREVLSRDETNETIEKALRLVQQFRIKVVAENMLGLPGQTDEDIVSMIRFYNRIRPDRNHFFWLRYYPGTRITEQFRPLAAEAAGTASEVFTRGGDTYHGGLSKKLVLLLYLMPLLPQKWVEGILAHRLYRLFPGVFPLTVLNMIASLTSRSHTDRIQQERFRRRYRHYAGKCVFR